MNDLIAAYLLTPALAQEGRVRYMYLDTAGLVTVGVGCMLPSSAAAAALPFAINGSPASPAGIVAAYNRVRSMPAGHIAGFYQLPVVLDDATIDKLTAQKCAGFVGDLQRIFAGFGQFPQAAQLALLDMAFNLGVGRAPSGVARGTGLQSYTHLCASVQARDWKTAATECDRNRSMPAFNLRNQWTRERFQEAACA